VSACVSSVDMNNEVRENLGDSMFVWGGAVWTMGD
jgi:hypothetical protein